MNGNCYSCKFLEVKPLNLVKTKFDPKLKIPARCSYAKHNLWGPRDNEWLLIACPESRRKK